MEYWLLDGREFPSAGLSSAGAVSSSIRWLQSGDGGGLAVLFPLAVAVEEDEG